MKHGSPSAGSAFRALLLAGSALLTVPPAAAQGLPDGGAHPIGGQVVAGAATVAHGPHGTTVTQSSLRAAIDWKSFDVGAQQSVQFVQPSAAAVTLNRVTGPDPSAIAGRIDATGQVILINQNGVIFFQGAQVNAAGLVVSAAGTGNRDFMAGGLRLDRPARPGAGIVNAGTLTMKQAGLAALVAPSVANSGTITAKLGHVVLAGARTATLDLYGDGLLALDVTSQVAEPANGPAVLVTNSGLIAAAGGTVQLTARAADGVVQTLVQSGGRISTSRATAPGGTIAIDGVGGGIVVTGQLAATGTPGGSVTITQAGASGGLALDGAGLQAPSVTLAAAGGGIALDHAHVTAGVLDLSVTGQGSVAGAAPGTRGADAVAVGGSPFPAHGTRGSVTESAASLSVGTLMATGAIAGDLVLNDPASVNRIATLGGLGVGGTLALADAGALTVAGPLHATGATLSAPSILLAGAMSVPGTLALGTAGSITEGNATLSIGTLAGAGTIGGDLLLNDPASINGVAALGSLRVGGTLALADAGALTVAGPLNAANATLTASALTLAGTISVPGTLALGATGSVTEGNDALSVGTLAGAGTIGGDLLLNDPASTNGIATLGSLRVGGTLALADAGALTVAGPLNAAGATLSAAALLLAATVSLGDGALVLGGGGVTEHAATLTAGTLAAAGTLGGDVVLKDPASVNNFATLGDLAGGGTLALAAAAGLTVAGTVAAPAIALAVPGALTLSSGAVLGATGGVLDLSAAGGIAEAASAQLRGTLLRSRAGIGGEAVLTGTANAVGTLGAFRVAGGLELADALPLSVAGPVSGTAIGIADAGGITLAGTLAAASIALAAGGTVTLAGGAVLGAPGARLDLSTRAGGITEAADARILAALLSDTGGIAGDALLTGSANAIGTLGDIRAGGRLEVVDSQGLTLGGTLAAAELVLATPGAVREAAGAVLTLGTLASLGTIGGGVTLAGPGTSIGTLGPFAAGGTLVLADAVPLALAGRVAAPAMALAAPAFTLIGTLDAPGGLTLAGGGMTEAAGAVLATALLTTGGATLDSAAAFAGSANEVGRLSDFADAADIVLNDAAALVLAGTIAAPRLVIDTEGAALTLADHARLLTGGRRPGAGAPPPEAGSGAPGAYLTAGSFTQPGSSEVAPLGGGVGLLRIDVVGAGGTIGFDRTQGLFGTGDWLVLDLPAGGRASGNLFVDALSVVYAPGGVSTALFGTINGLGGQAAAGQGRIAPRPVATAAFNNCPIHGLDCVLLPQETLPTASPLSSFSIATMLARGDNADLLLPLVAEPDY